jgi:hypothetical protein|tara:strand:- start:458 stop:658 length:201 start_codon:yes stop_codon:yes gene_type:complete
MKNRNLIKGNKMNIGDLVKHKSEGIGVVMSSFANSSGEIDNYEVLFAQNKTLRIQPDALELLIVNK